MPDWTIDFASARVEAEILALPAGHVARFLRYAERMQKWGPDLGMPHTRAMGRRLFELCVQAADRTARLFHYAAPGTEDRVREPGTFVNSACERLPACGLQAEANAAASDCKRAVPSPDDHD